MQGLTIWLVSILVVEHTTKRYYVAYYQAVAVGFVGAFSSPGTFSHV